MLPRRQSPFFPPSVKLSRLTVLSIENNTFHVMSVTKVIQTLCAFLNNSNFSQIIFTPQWFVQNIYLQCVAMPLYSCQHIVYKRVVCWIASEYQSRIVNRNNKNLFKSIFHITLSTNSWFLPNNRRCKIHSLITTLIIGKVEQMLTTVDHQTPLCCLSHCTNSCHILC